ncbi:hypothetical protein JTB14_022163 [Gonioctena quinquepunctata]|nr:hypothetical protein JTB14_022163 [Gonioctena quinquepunctata]
MSHIYDNFPLKSLNKATDSCQAKTLISKPIFSSESKDKKRKSSPDIQVAAQSFFGKRSSKSFSDMTKKSCDSSKGVEKEEFGSSDTLKAGIEEKVCNQNGHNKKSNMHSTPTSTMDDGYGSSNSTPQVSGNELQAISGNAYIEADFFNHFTRIGKTIFHMSTHV